VEADTSRQAADFKAAVGHLYFWFILMTSNV